MTQQRLENPEAGNWLLYRRTYNGHGFSPLKQINTENVKSLVPVWTFSTGVLEGHEAPPMVNNGVMFVTTPQNQVLALNAKTGDLIWRYKHKMPEDLFQLHPTNRGVAMWEDKLFLAATDDRLIALDAKTGKEIWNTQGRRLPEGPVHDAEPLVVHGKVMVGVIRRRVRRARLHRGVRRQRRQGVVADLHRAGARTTRQRDLVGRRLEDRRRLGLDHRHL